jgi:hypothetical protein
MTVNRNLTSLYNFFDEVIVKLNRIREYWERFYLTLPGRINVCKTFMLSQIGYLGCIIMPSQQQLKVMQEIVDKFCVGKFHVAKAKLYTPVSQGGLGLICLRDYLTALQCSWIKRVTQHWGDNWRFDIKQKCYGNPLIADQNSFSPVEKPILYNICSSFGRFRTEFYKKDSNYLKALIFKNPMFRRSRDDNRLLCEGFFGRDTSFEEMSRIAKLQYNDLFTRGRPKSLHDVNLEFNVNFTLVTYMRVHEALQFYVNSRKNYEESPAVSLEFFIKSFNRGSKPFRTILRYAENSRLKIENLNTVTTFFSLIGIPRSEESVLKKCWGMWNSTYFGNVCREFIYKFYNNILGLNSRVCKFVPGHDAECTICIISGESRPVQQESFVHVFYECVHTDKYRDAMSRALFPETINLADSEKRAFWFLGLLPGPWGCVSNPLVDLTVNLINFNIWNMKLKKTLVPVNVFKDDIIQTVSRKLYLSKELRDARIRNNFHICRLDLG